MAKGNGRPNERPRAAIAPSDRADVYTARRTGCGKCAWPAQTVVAGYKLPPLEYNAYLQSRRPFDRNLQHSVWCCPRYVGRHIYFDVECEAPLFHSVRLPLMALAGTITPLEVSGRRVLTAQVVKSTKELLYVQGKSFSF